MHRFNSLISFSTKSEAILILSRPLSNLNILLKFPCQRAKRGALQILLLQIIYDQEKRGFWITRISSVRELKAKLCPCLCRDTRAEGHLQAFSLCTGSRTMAEIVLLDWQGSAGLKLLEMMCEKWCTLSPALLHHGYGWTWSRVFWHLSTSFAWTDHAHL